MPRSTGHDASVYALPRLFVAAPLHAGATIDASPEQHRHLRTVLRRDPGDRVRLFNGTDGEWIARIQDGGAAMPDGGRSRRLGRGADTSFAIDAALRPQIAEGGPWLAFALLKRDTTDLVVRQAVELGVARVLPVRTARTNASHVNEDRLRAIAIEAAEQCERLTIPPIDPVAPLERVLAAWPAGRRLFAAFERSGGWSDPASGSLVSPGAAGDDTALLIGPEGGFSAEEREFLGRWPFVTALSLGPLVLRAETAAVAGLARLPRRG